MAIRATCWWPIPAAIIPGAVMNVRPVGVLVMEDNAGEDEKIIAVPSAHLTQRYDRVLTYTDLPEITLKQIEHFFQHYKDLEPGKWVKILRWGDADDARRLIREGIERVRRSRQSQAASVASPRRYSSQFWPTRSLPNE